MLYTKCNVSTRNIDPNIRNISSGAVFKNNYLKFMKQCKIMLLNVSNLKDKIRQPSMPRSQSFMKSTLRTIESNF